MDDETYVKMDYKPLPNQKSYLAIGRDYVSSKHKFVFDDKFAKRYDLTIYLQLWTPEKGFHYIFNNHVKDLHGRMFEKNGFCH